MNLKMHQVDSFTRDLFGGNPAAVIVLEAWLEDSVMQAIAIENNLSETAFLVADEPGSYLIRWFSPICEIDFCGHATLAAAHVLFNQQPTLQELHFTTLQVGELKARRGDNGLIAMDFPSCPPHMEFETPSALLDGVSVKPSEVWRNQQAYFLVYQQQAQVEALEVDLDLLKTLAPYDVVVTAPGEEHDFVSRYFWPANGGAEDPVTGSIHAGLTPFWTKRLGKDELQAYQASKRGGVLHCQQLGDRVTIAGHAKTYFEGTVFL
ncbi:PhzF family phenazine biosynthesis protein [Agarivorans albus]|uniref:Phenazine biosynthesis protein PhzF like n=1 Tax=Agarivorans albus MKT 106 TaxID=1331007 RepID=R9PFN9_AGAAL|nr:PhzF family phenazine biosynthesis protein [Agarivorans albus]GAD00194.1 phenazine biosynthesis protein PhzF like [Agarivorans albus MKT 106]